jgi:hypothetical protein
MSSSDFGFQMGRFDGSRSSSDIELPRLEAGGSRDRISAARGRIIITGTGRAGTTFPVQLFTALGFGTGFTRNEFLQDVDEISHAGLERALVDEGNPYVIKSPWFADDLALALRENRIKIYAAVLPVRDLFGAAESRRRVHYAAVHRGLDPKAQPGALWYTEQPEHQEDTLARQFYKTIFPLIQYQVPTFLEFSRLIEDPDYLFAGLQPLMTDHRVTHAEFHQAHDNAARPELVHDFEDHVTGSQLYKPPR